MSDPLPIERVKKKISVPKEVIEIKFTVNTETLRELLVNHFKNAAFGPEKFTMPDLKDVELFVIDDELQLCEILSYKIGLKWVCDIQEKGD